MEGFLRALAMDRAAEHENRNWLHTLERERIMDAYRESADRRAEAKAERDEAMGDLRLQLMQGKIDEQKYDAKVAEIKAKYADDLEKSKINKNNRTGTGGGKGRGGSKGSTWYAKDENGNVHTFTASSKDNAHSVAGGKGWTLIGSTTTSTSEKTESKGKTTTTTTKSSKTDAVKSKAGGNKMPGVK